MGTIISSASPQSVKLIRIDKPSSQFTSITGTLSESKTGSILIPAGTVTAGSLLELTARASKTGTAGTLQMRIYINDAPDLTTPSILGSTPVMGATSLAGQLQRTIDVLDSGTANIVRLSASGAYIDATNDTQSLQSVVTDWTIDQYIILALTNGSTADSSVGAILALKIFKI